MKCFSLQLWDIRGRVCRTVISGIRSVCGHRGSGNFRGIRGCASACARSSNVTSYQMDQCYACGSRRGAGKHSYNLLELPARLSVRLCLFCQHEIAADEPRMFWTLVPICGHKHFRLQAYVAMRLNGLASDADGRVAMARMADDLHGRH
jgi:hypothetical protein